MLHSIQAFKRRLELNVISRGLNDRPSALLQRDGRGHSDGEGQHGLHETRHQQRRGPYEGGVHPGMSPG